MKERLKAFRKALGLKQREIAARLGVTVGTVGQWESGISSIPSPRLYQLCNEYGVSRQWLETGAGEMFAVQGTRDPSDVLREAATALFNELSPRGQAALLAALKARIDSGMERGDSPPTNATVKTISIQNGTVDGDVTIN